MSKKDTVYESLGRWRDRAQNRPYVTIVAALALLLAAGGTLFSDQAELPESELQPEAPEVPENNTTVDNVSVHNQSTVSDSTDDSNGNSTVNTTG